MITIIIHRDGEIEYISEEETDEHIVIVDTREGWTNSPSKWTLLEESEQAELINTLRNEDNFEDRNP